MVPGGRPSDDARDPADIGSGAGVLIAAHHALVGESVRAALTERGYDPVVVLRVDDARGRSWARSASQRPGQRAAAPQVGILLPQSFEAESPSVRALLTTAVIPWLVLAPDSSGPTWGAYYESGASLVVPTTAGLEEVCRRLDDLVAGHGALSRRRRRRLIDDWRTALRERDALDERVGSLTTREREVLLALHAGVGVHGIAEEGAVSPATVRTQVKMILRKLDVSSQIAAVAAYTQVQAPPPEPDRRKV